MSENQDEGMARQLEVTDRRVFDGERQNCDEGLEGVGRDTELDSTGVSFSAFSENVCHEEDFNMSIYL